MQPARDGRVFAFADGTVQLSPDGAVAAVEHPTRGRSMLLSEHPDAVEAAFHSPARRWGKGFVILADGGRRFDTPTQLDWRPDGVDLRYDLGPLQLRVRRRIADSWHEQYEFNNLTDAPLHVGSVAISTPWRDLYGSSRDCLRQAVHAHLWTGGCDAWVWAVPMDGSSPGLGLQLTDGELSAYSVESRDAVTGSNIRGHLYVHVTDFARSPHALGGQRELVLEPGATYRLGWRLAWYDGLADFHADRQPLVTAPEVSAEVGRPLELRLAADAVADRPTPVRSDSPGTHYVEVHAGARRTRVGLYFHPPLADLARARARYILDRQRAPERPDSRAGAFLPYDTELQLTVLPGAWRDFSDVRERVGMALLLQEIRDRGWWSGGELERALAAYRRFVDEHVVAADGTVADDADRAVAPRLYNFPWFARFLLAEGDLDRAMTVVQRYYELGGTHFLAFGVGPLLTELATRLDTAGRGPDAARMRTQLAEHAATFLAYGDELPPHEVNYEQSMVAPLLELLISAHTENPDAVPAAELTRRLPWLTSFAADQPDARLRHIPIRHWDGYWFGGERLWGDVFPHYWSVLSAAVFLNWPATAADRSTRDRLGAVGRAILRGNLVNFSTDGSATCAFVYPSCVNGRPAHRADPLANDQDWALVYALRLGLT